MLHTTNQRILFAMVIVFIIIWTILSIIVGIASTDGLTRDTQWRLMKDSAIWTGVIALWTIFSVHVLKVC